MNIKVNHTKTSKERPFPKLMIATDGDIVFFREYMKGTVLKYENGVFGPGDYIESFIMERFKDFEGSITLSND